MIRNGLGSLVVLVVLLSGCLAENDSQTVPDCAGRCEPGQACRDGLCFDTCLTECANPRMECVSNLCIPRITKCALDTRRCSEDLRSVEVCDGVIFTKKFDCPEDQTCADGACASVKCVNDQKRCRDNNVEICRNESYTLYSECSAPQKCSDKTFTCENPLECSGEVKRCDAEGNIQICSEGHWVSHKKCPSGQACDSARLECVPTDPCNHSEKKCEKNSVYVCAGTRWKHEKDCTGGFRCDEGECVKAKCVDGQKRCFVATNGVHYVQECLGGWYASTGCPVGEVCLEKGDSVECVGRVCDSGKYMCEGNILFRCQNNAYSEIERCGDKKCSQESGLCESESEKCPSGKSECVGLTYRYCEGGDWKTTECTEKQECTDSGCRDIVETGDWDYVQGFEKLGLSSTYGTENKFNDGGIKWFIVARTKPDNGYAIEGKVSVIFKGDKGTHITITGIPKAVKRFGFTWRGWGGNADKGKLDILVDGAVEGSVSFTASDKAHRDEILTINRKVGSIKLMLSNKKDGRIIIDNVRWSY